MNKYRFLYLVWLFPAYLLYLTGQQAMVHKSTIDTYETGTTYMAEIKHLDVKQIAAQSNAYADIEFEVNGEVIERRLSLTIQMAQTLSNSQVIPIKYKKGAYQEIVLFPTFEIQKSTSMANIGIAIVAFLILTFVAWLVHRYAYRKVHNKYEKFEIERID